MILCCCNNLAAGGAFTNAALAPPASSSSPSLALPSLTSKRSLQAALRTFAKRKPTFSSPPLQHAEPVLDEDLKNSINEDYTDIDAGKDKLICLTFKAELPQRCSDALLPALISVPALLVSNSAHAEVFYQQINPIYGDLGAGLEISVQVLYLAALLGLVGVASYFVVKQVLIRRELESAARDLQDRVRAGEATPVEYFELGAVMLRKKFYILATKYLEQAIAKWDGDLQDLAQVHNALGYSYVNDDQVDRGIAEYLKAVKLQPGYVIAWNNLGSVYEKKKNFPKALEAYEQALLFDPNNAVAREYRDAVKKRVDRLEGIPVKYD